MSGSELLLEYLTRYFPILFFVIIALTFGLWSLIIKIGRASCRERV